MILSIKQQIALNKIIEKYADLTNSKDVIFDEEMKYVHSEYENLIIAIGNVKNVNKHLEDENYEYDCELAYYYQNECKIYITAFKNNGKLMIVVHKNMGTGLECSKTIERIEVDYE